MSLKVSVVLVLAFMSCALAAPMTAERYIKMMDFIQNVPLAEPRYSLPSTGIDADDSLGATDNKTQGYVVEGQLLPFTSNVRGPIKEDVIHSCLFGQLASDYKYDRETQGDDWYKYYSSVMETLGWVISDFSFQRYQVSGGKFTMDQVVLDILESLLTGNELLIGKQVIAGFKSLSDKDGRIVLFEHSSYKDNAGNFMVSPVNQGPNGDVVMAIAGFEFSSSQSSTGFLFFHWDSSKTKVYKGTQIIQLDETIYGFARDTVIERLGSRTKTGAKEIPMPPIPSL